MANQSKKDPLELAMAQGLLRQFTCLEPGAAVEVDPVAVRSALLLVAEHSDYQLLGICADTTEQAQATLVDYLTALGFTRMPTVPPIAGPIYVKFNPKSGNCHSDAYVGAHRGVLVSCQSAYDGDVNETFGHLPLDLFEDWV